MNVLTPRGWIAALAIGAAVVFSGSLPYAVVLFAFFIPSIAISRVGRARKRRLTDIGKTGARDEWQVLANGGVAAFCAIAAALTRNPAFAAAFAGAFAAASADTWGTEIGTLAKDSPRSILSGRRLAAGLSGGVTLSGTLAEAGGALLVALTAGALGIAAWWAVAAGGIAGALADSIAGAGAQELRYCPQCERSCETDPHSCGSPTKRIRGFSWLRNDGVNVLATITGAAVAFAMWAVFR